MTTSAPQATCGFSTPRLASRSPVVEIDEKADDVGRAEVDRQSQGDAPGRRDADDGCAANKRARRETIGAQDLGQRARRGEVDRADLGKRLDEPFEVAARVRQRRLGDADVHGANRGRGARSPSQSFASTSARATGASERGAISTWQSRRGFMRQARRHFLLGSTSVSPSSKAWPLTSRTVQAPQAPRPPQAPTRRTP